MLIQSCLTNIESLPVFMGGGNIQVVSTCRYSMANGIVRSASCYHQWKFSHILHPFMLTLNLPTTTIVAQPFLMFC
jgi:hypothetical protein